MATFTVTSSAGLTNALKAAHGGDTIALAPGSYTVSLYQYHTAGTGSITITSANASNQAVISSLGINQGSGLKFANLTFASTLYNAPTSSTAPSAWVIYDSQNIAFDHINFHGTLDNNPQDDANGIRIQGSTNVSITNSEFQQFYNAITDLGNNGVNISNNYIHDIRNDGIDNGGTSNITISGNSFTNFYPVGQVGGTGDHADAIQFWTSNTTTDASNITVSNNTFVRGSGSYIQGIFITDQVGLHYDNVTVTGNKIFGGEYNGITVANGNGVNVSNNFVEGYADMTSWIRLETSTGITMNNNVSDSLYQVGTNVFTSQLNNQYIGAVAAVSSLAAVASIVAPPAITVVAEVGKASVYGPAVSGSALTGDVGTSLALADVGVGTNIQQSVPSTGLTLAGQYGTLKINPNGTYTYSETKTAGMIVGQTYDDHFTLTVTGTGGAVKSSTLDFLVSDTGVGDGHADTITAGATAANISNFGAGSLLTSGTAGVDTFAFGGLSASTPTNQALIWSFKAGDIIDLSKVDPLFHVVSAFDGHAHELVLSHLGTGNWEIYGDTTGSGTANFELHLMNMASAYNLSASDFHL
jgi:VCBS repeat-containing protein